MAQPPNIDGVLITWGDRLFYPGNRVVKTRPQPRLSGEAMRQRAAAIRKRIEATVVRRAPQVMVKVTGGGRGMKAIAAHFRYISKNGRLEIEDQRGETMSKSKGNAIAFDEAADKMGADVCRWLYCRSNPAAHIHFGYAAADEVRSRFVLKLWNVYAFFCNYARLDKFDPAAYVDEEKKRIEAAIQKKIEGEEIAVSEEEGKGGAQIIDLMEALRASLDKGGKPAPAQEQERKPAKRAEPAAQRAEAAKPAPKARAARK